MRDRNHDNLVRFYRVDNAERKATDQCTTKPVANPCAECGLNADRVYDVLNVIEEIMPKP
jgi:hypothetical protein